MKTNRTFGTSEKDAPTYSCVSSHFTAVCVVHSWFQSYVSFIRITECLTFSLVVVVSVLLLTELSTFRRKTNVPTCSITCKRVKNDCITKPNILFFNFNRFMFHNCNLANIIYSFHFLTYLLSFFLSHIHTHTHTQTYTL